MSNVDDYTLEDLLLENEEDFENLENDLENSQEDLEDQLEEVSKKLKKNIEELSKKLKKEVKSEVMNYYHDNKDVVKTSLKGFNSTVHALIDEAKSRINDAISISDDSDEIKELRSLRHQIVRFSRKYTHKYHMLKLKLFLGNAGVDIKNFFS
jgi:predicted transcriptional regulator